MEAISSIGVVEGMYIGFLVIIVIILPVMISYYLARKKNRPPFVWVVLTLIFSWPIVLAMLLFVKGTKGIESERPVSRL